MEAVPRTQTAFRLKNSLLERLKWNARREHKSVNAYVEEKLEEIAGRGVVFPKLPPEFFERSVELERFTLKESILPKEYEGKDGFEQAELDKKYLLEALYEEHCL